MSNIFDRLTAPEALQNDNAGLADSGDGLSEQDQPASQDSGRTPQRLREVLQFLLNDGLLEQVRKPNLYRTAMHELQQLNALLEPLDLQARVDEVRGLVFLQVLRDGADSVEDDWSHPLVRRQRLTLEQSLLLAILRQQFVHHEQDAGVGDGNAWVAVDELVSSLSSFTGDSGSESKERNRVLTLLNQLKTHGVVTDPDAHGRVQIRPVIAHLANPENLAALLQQMREIQQAEDVQEQQK